MTNSEGTARRITYYGEAVLHKPCQPVTEFNSELKALIEDMFASMYEANGVGLAANQIGVDARVFVVDCPDASEEHVVAHIVNPVLELPPPPRELVTEGEGCLSVPGQYAELGRPGVATVTGFDMDGKPITIVGTGLLARCLQHEVDHLDGTLYVDRLPAAQRKEILAAAGLGN
ncbi:peptide deformylase 3 [Longispora fulva]|uniref:Peptide deformylase n=1 Tax=Longispora fulva TaxID=619741 RepID=A0A8J7GG72_9ACTN|nr:peptide deformylase [Longispora fulva]MBG6135443.1 peptide deformylase [Longispora fulva]GIG56314.1 peptide deformylase 3 [Longispora fulva]